MRSLLLVHGSGSGPWIFDGWNETWPDAEIVAVDLQAGLEVAHATIADYAASVVRAAAPLPLPLALVGWSLGGLVAMVAAHRVRPDALVLLDASPPLEVQGLRDIDPAPGTFDPVDAGGSPPPGMRYRRESSLAMGERDRGVSVPSLPEGVRALVVYGSAFAHDRGPVLAAHLGAEALDAGAVSHWDLVLEPPIRERVARWLRETS